MDIKIERLLVAFVIAISIISLNASHTVFIPRQITFDSVYELALNNYDIYHHQWRCQEGKNVELYMVPFFQSSSNRSSIAKYFFPNDASCLNIREDGLGNIGSLSLELISSGTGFSSFVTMKPQRQVSGSLFNLRFNFSNYCNAWANIVFTVMHARHSLHLAELDLQNPGTLPGLQTAIEALNNSTWCFGKLSPCALSRTGVDDIQFKFGYDWYYCNEQAHIGIYAVGSVFTGKKTEAEFLFEPLVGSNHPSIGGGFNGDVDIYRTCYSTMNIMFDAKYRYVFGAKEIRSFDLCPNDDWSRYLQVVHKEDPFQSFPGINFFTRPMHVIPRSTFELWTAIHYGSYNFHIEVGYDFWWKQREKVCLACPLGDNLGILDIPGLCNLQPTTASTFNISQSISLPNAGVSDTTFTSITTKNINFDSAAHPTAFSNTIYGSISHSKNRDKVSYLIGMGASYEFGYKTTALSNWAIWGTLGLNF